VCFKWKGANTTQIALTGGVTVAYSATLIRGMGYTSKEATLLNMPAGLVSITVQLIPGFAIRRGHPRWAWAFGTLLPAYVFLSSRPLYSVPSSSSI
jgi:hypothetical protein